MSLNIFLYKSHCFHLSNAFKLGRSALKIGSFEFKNLQYFNSTFMNLKIARLSFECERQKSRVHGVFTLVIAL